MASSPKLLPLFFLFTTLIFSLQTHARDSQFFSKVTRHRDYHPTTTTTTNNNNNNDLKENEFSTLTKQQDQEEVEPIFIPQTTGTGYGLYGHENGLHPPTTTEKNYAAELKGLSEYRNYKKNYVDERNSNYYYHGGAGYNGGVEKQGMSDTRFLENGKYFHDVNTEKKNNYGANYIPYTNNYNNHYSSNYKNNNGYYGNYAENNYEEFYNNGNAMQGKQYQNQLPEEEEFDFDP